MMNHDDPAAALNGRLRPRKSTYSEVQRSKTIRKADQNFTEDQVNIQNESVEPLLKLDEFNVKSNLRSIKLLCPYCEKILSSKRSLSKHVNSIHLSLSQKPGSKTKCQFCTHSEENALAVFKHMIDSHSNQYFACLNCEIRFSSTVELTNHNSCNKLKSHSIRPYRSKLRRRSIPNSSITREQSINISNIEKNPGNTIFSNNFNSIVISCELQPSQDDNADIENKITTNVILPQCNKLVNSQNIERSAVIVLDNFQWNKKVTPSFSFHNNDADQILSRLGVVHRSPRTAESTKRDAFKNTEEPSKFEKCFDTNFYAKVASNVQENLKKFLDGTFNRLNLDPDNTIKTRKSKKSAIINTVDGFPILLAAAQYSRNVFDGYLPRLIAPKHKWKWDSNESDRLSISSQDLIKGDSHTNNCIITFISQLDIWTQLCMRQRYVAIYDTQEVPKKTEKENAIARELKEILESRVIPVSTTQYTSKKKSLSLECSKDPSFTTKLSQNSKNSRSTNNSHRNDFAASLGLMPMIPKQEVVPAILSGEWVRPRRYVCCACGEQSPDSKALCSHISMQHPNAQVSHYEIVGESLLNANISEHLYIPPSQVINRTRPLRGSKECTKCKKNIALEDLHEHMLECAGDTPTVRKKCRYRPFGVRRRRPRIPDNRLRKKIRKQLRNRQTRQQKLRRSIPRIRSEVGDGETIRKMLADLPAKRHRATINPASSGMRPRMKYENSRIKLRLRRRTTEDFKMKKSDLAMKNCSIKNDFDKKSSNEQQLQPQQIFCSNSNPVTIVQNHVENNNGCPEGQNLSTNTNNATSTGSSPSQFTQMSLNSSGSNRSDNNKSDANTNQSSTQQGSGGQESSKPQFNENKNDKSKTSTPQKVPLKHSIERLTATTDTNNRAMRFRHDYFFNQEYSTNYSHLPAGQQPLFENEAIVIKLDKPPLHHVYQRLDPQVSLKIKCNKPRKGLNDCINMLKNKLVDPIPGDNPIPDNPHELSIDLNTAPVTSQENNLQQITKSDSSLMNYETNLSEPTNECGQTQIHAKTYVSSPLDLSGNVQRNDQREPTITEEPTNLCTKGNVQEFTSQYKESCDTLDLSTKNTKSHVELSKKSKTDIHNLKEKCSRNVSPKIDPEITLDLSVQKIGNNNVNATLDLRSNIDTQHNTSFRDRCTINVGSSIDLSRKISKELTHTTEIKDNFIDLSCKSMKNSIHFTGTKDTFLDLSCKLPRVPTTNIDDTTDRFDQYIDVSHNSRKATDHAIESIDLSHKTNKPSSDGEIKIDGDYIDLSHKPTNKSDNRAMEKFGNFIDNSSKSLNTSLNQVSVNSNGSIDLSCKSTKTSTVSKTKKVDISIKNIQKSKKLSTQNVDKKGESLNEISLSKNKTGEIVKNVEESIDDLKNISNNNTLKDGVITDDSGTASIDTKVSEKLEVQVDLLCKPVTRDSEKIECVDISNNSCKIENIPLPTANFTIDQSPKINESYATNKVEKLNKTTEKNILSRSADKVVQQKPIYDPTLKIPQYKIRAGVSNEKNNKEGEKDDTKSEDSNEIDILPKEIVDILGSMPPQHRNTLLNVLPQVFAKTVKQLKLVVDSNTASKEISSSPHRNEIATQTSGISIESTCPPEFLDIDTDKYLIDPCTGAITERSESDKDVLDISGPSQEKVVDLTSDDNVLKIVSCTGAASQGHSTGTLLNISNQSKTDINKQKVSNDQTASLRAVRIKSASGKNKNLKVDNKVPMIALNIAPPVQNTGHIVCEEIVSIDAENTSMAIQQAEVSSTQQNGVSSNKALGLSGKVTKINNTDNFVKSKENKDTETTAITMVSKPSNDSNITQEPKQKEMQLSSKIVNDDYNSDNKKLRPELNDTILPRKVEASLPHVPLKPNYINDPILCHTEEDDPEDNVSLALVKKKQVENRSVNGPLPFKKIRKKLESHKKCNAIDRHKDGVKNRGKKRKQKKNIKNILTFDNNSEITKNKDVIDIKDKQTIVKSSVVKKDKDKLVYVMQDSNNIETEQTLILLKHQLMSKMDDYANIMKTDDTIKHVKSTSTLHNTESFAITESSFKVIPIQKQVNATAILENSTADVKLTKSIRQKRGRQSKMVFDINKSEISELAVQDNVKTSKQSASSANGHSTSILLRDKCQEAEITVSLIQKEKSGINQSIEEESIPLQNALDTCSQLLRRSMRGKSTYNDKDEIEITNDVVTNNISDVKPLLTKKQLIFSKLLLDEENSSQITGGNLQDKNDSLTSNKISECVKNNYVISSNCNTELVHVNDENKVLSFTSSIDSPEFVHSNEANNVLSITRKRKSPHLSQNLKKKKLPIAVSETKGEIIKPQTTTLSNDCDQNREINNVNEANTKASNECELNVKINHKQVGTNTESNDKLEFNIIKDFETVKRASKEKRFVSVRLSPIVFDENNPDEQINNRENLPSPADPEPEVILEESADKNKSNLRVNSPNMVKKCKETKSGKDKRKSSNPLSTMQDKKIKTKKKKLSVDRSERVFHHTSINQEDACKDFVENTVATDDQLKTRSKSVIVMTPQSTSKVKNSEHYTKDCVNAEVIKDCIYSDSQEPSTSTNDGSKRYTHFFHQDIYKASNDGDSDDSSKSDIPLKKYFEGMSKNINQTDDSGINISECDKDDCDSSIHCHRHESPQEQTKSDQFMESFGFYSERKPRKSNLIATKKISETFHGIANEGDDLTTPVSKDRITKKSQNESKKSRKKAGTATTSTPKKVTKPKSRRKLGKRRRRKKVHDSNMPYCSICEKEFRRWDNLYRHQLTPFHISRLQDADINFDVIPFVEGPNFLLVYKKRLEKLKKITKQYHKQRLKNGGTSAALPQQLPTYEEILAEVNKVKNAAARKQRNLARRDLSRDQALFLDCCELLKESHKNDSAGSVKPFDCSIIASESNLDNFEKVDNRSDGDVDSITAKNILESEEVRNLENDLISGLKEASVINHGVGIVQHFNLKTTIEDYNEDSEKISDVRSVEPIFDREEFKSTQGKKQKTKLPSNEDNVNTFEDKFDLIKRKWRSQAAAVKNVQPAQEKKLSAKTKKKSGKRAKVKKGGTTHHSAVLTKGALKGFDGIKVSIPTSDINISAIVPSLAAHLPDKRRKKSCSKKRKEKSILYSPSHSGEKYKDVKKTPPKQIDVYEFMDNEDGDMFDFRTSTLLERFKSSNKDLPSTSKAGQPFIQEPNESSASASDVDDFVYMSDDYLCSADETENSLMSCELGKTSNDIKKYVATIKRKEPIDKSAAMEKIFKCNTTHIVEKNNLKVDSLDPKADLDQLFDSLLEKEPKSSIVNNETQPSRPEDRPKEVLISATDKDVVEINHNEDLSDNETGVALHRVRRKCTVGKQNILAETWSSESEPDLASMPRPNSVESVAVGTCRKKKSKKSSVHHASVRRNRHITFETVDNESRVTNSVNAKSARREKRSRSELAVNWSSAEEDESQQSDSHALVEQHGWIVGDSHKKLVTMLAHAKGRKRDDRRSFLD